MDPVPHSSVARIVWPALASPSAARRLALLQQLDESQWWPQEALRAWQFRQLGVLLAHARGTVPFYAAPLREAGLAPGHDLTPEAWARIPVLTRDDLQTAGQALQSTAPSKTHGRPHEVASSGSSGKPVVALATATTQLFWDCLTVRDHLWHRRDLRGTLAAIRNYPDGRALYPHGHRARTWGPALAALFPTGPSVGLSITASTDQQAEWLRRRDPDYLLTFPSVLSALLRHCEDRGLRFPRLRQVRTVSEVLSPNTRAACEATWRVPVVDAYSAMEVGYIALQCPDASPNYHAQAETTLVEVLRDDGTACGPGETGRVVVTPLHNFAMPLIRYAVGDQARVGPACSCGRGLPVLERIAGRVRNMLRLPDGRRIWPRLSEMRYREIAPIRQYQVVQTSLERLEMRLAAARPLTLEEEAELCEVVLRRLGHALEIVFSYHEEIPRGPGGKFEDFKCEIETP